MILIINGPFGVGKSTSAQMVGERWAAHVFNPEAIGRSLWDLGVRQQGDDYRENPVWRDLVIAATRSIHQHVAKRIVIPMNLLREETHDDLVARWKEIDQVTLIRLSVGAETLRNRILGRSEEEGPHSWCLSHVDEDVVATSQARYGILVDTERLSPSEVCDEILRAL